MRFDTLARRLMCFALGLGLPIFLSACGGGSEQLVVRDNQNGMVSLVEFSTHGATGRYIGSLQPIKASHPIILSPGTIARVLSGIQLSIIPSDASADSKGIKPRPIFSPSDVATLAPGIAAALKQANPNHYVKFLVGTDPETTDGSLYVDGPTIKFTLSHYRSTTRRRDESLAIFTLSFTPESAQLTVANAPNWIEEDAGNPHLAIAYRKLSAGDVTQEAEIVPLVGPASLTPQPDGQDMRTLIEKQAQELDAVKAELEALKKQLGARPAAPKTSP